MRTGQGSFCKTMGEGCDRYRPHTNGTQIQYKYTSRYRHRYRNIHKRRCRCRHTSICICKYTNRNNPKHRPKHTGRRAKGGGWPCGRRGAAGHPAQNDKFRVMGKNAGGRGGPPPGRGAGALAGGTAGRNHPAERSPPGRGTGKKGGTEFTEVGYAAKFLTNGLSADKLIRLEKTKECYR